MYVHIVPTAVAQREDHRHAPADHRAQLHRLFAPRGAPPDAATLPVNAYVADEALTVEALLPGISPEDIEVTLERGVLTLTATRRGPTPARGQAWYRHEFAPGVVTRALRLPFPVAGDGVTADFAHGRLTITAPKAAVARARTIPISRGQPREPLPAPPSR